MKIKKTDTKYPAIYYNICISILFLLLIWSLDLKEEYILMLLYSINSAVVFAILFREEIVHYKGLSPNLLLLVGYILRLVYPSIEMSIGALNGEIYDFLISSNNVTDYMFPTVVWMNIYYMLFYYAFNKFAKGITLDAFIKPYVDKYHFTTIAILIFIPGVLYEIVVSFIPVYFIPSMANTVFGNLTKLALLMQVFNAALSYSPRKHKVLVALVILEMTRAIFFGFYKSPIMMPFIFYMLYVFLHQKNQKKAVVTPRLIGLAALFFIFISFFIYPFMEIKRYESGFSNAIGEDGIATQQYSNIEIIKDVLSGKKKEETESLSTTGRFNAIPANAFFYKEAVTKGLKTALLAVNNAELLVPRFINPNKHGSEAGQMTFSYVTTGSFKNADSAVSSLFVGQFASAYIMGGGLLAVLLALFNGFLMITYLDYLSRNIHNPFALLLIVGQLFATLEGFEEIHDGGVLRAGLTLVYMAIVFLTNPIFKRGKRNVTVKRIS